MESLRPIFWGQGMFLQPQHFQQQDCYHEARLQHYLQLLHPFCWGVKSFLINETALQNFVFEVEQCELITWDGTIIRFQAEPLPSNARTVPRSFAEALTPGGRPLSVYLGLKRLQREESNVDPHHEMSNNTASGEQYQRFRLHEVETPDLFAGDGYSCKLQYLIHEIRILFEGDATVHTQDYELVKVAELLRATEGPGAILSKRYIPPSLAIHASPVLESMLKEVRDLLTAKGRELAEYKQRHHMRTVELGARDTAYFLMLQTVNRYIPLFHHHLEVRDTHPCTLYTLLRQLIGELSTFSETVSVLGGPLPAYRHEQLWECFDAAIRVAKELVNGLTRGPEYVMPLVFDGEYFAANLDKRFFEGNNRYYLSVKIDMPPRELERHLTSTGKVCSREEMAALVRQALSGLPLRYLETPPEELPRLAHCRYFELDHHGTLWKRIEQRQNIAVYCQLPPQETEMQLLVIYGT
jgi:type VI secretion system protein ImpJ